MNTVKMNRKDMFNYMSSHHSTNPDPILLSCSLKHPPRYYQNNALHTAVDYLMAGFTRLLYVSPTGSGKTMLAAMTACSIKIREILGINDKIRKNPDYKVRVLFIADKERLINQAIENFAYCDDVELVTHSAFSKLPDEIIEGGWDMAFIDEAHHEPMGSIQKLLDYMGLKAIFGLTATPERGDGLLLKFERYIFALTKSDAVRRKIISLPHINSVIDTGGKDKVEITKQVFDLHGHDMKNMIVYFKTQKECNNFHEYLVERGFSSYVAEKTDDVDEVIQRFENGEFNFLINCQRFGEGIDVKNCISVFLARQFRSKTEKEQYIGRCIRVDSESHVWELVSPFKDNILAKDIFPIVKHHRLIYNRYSKWHTDFLEYNEDDDIYDKEYLEEFGEDIVA